jgi:DNA-binding NarL/FixJ family response regulator
LALAAASNGDRTSAQAYAEEVSSKARTGDADVVLAWVKALSSGHPTHAIDAFDISAARGILDPCVISYRARPQLLAVIAAGGEARHHQLKNVLIRANDRELLQDLTMTAPRDAWRPRLTPREIEVYRLMVDGLSNRRIAARLVIAESTAKLHVRHVLEKLCARSRAEAVAKWRDVLDN